MPLSLVGEAPAVKELDGILLQNMSTVEVECLPGDIPHEIEVDLAGLVKIDQSLHVADLTVGKGVTVLTDPEKAIVLVTGRRIEVIEEEVPEAEAEAEAVPEAKKEEAAPEASQEQKPE